MKPTMPPELRAELAAERDRRQLALLRLAPSVCGFAVEPLTVGAFADLQIAGNHLVVRFLSSVSVEAFPSTRAEIAAVLWRLSPFYRRREVSWWRTPFLDWRQTRLLRRLRRLPHAQAVALDKGLAAMIEEAFQDAPMGGDVKWKPLKAQPPSITEGLLVALARRYGWPPQTILNFPVAAAFACLRTDHIAQGEDVVDRSNQKIADWLLGQYDAAQARN